MADRKFLFPAEKADPEGFELAFLPDDPLETRSEHIGGFENRRCLFSFDYKKISDIKRQGLPASESREIGYLPIRHPPN